MCIRDRIQTQKVELQYLRMQIKPHFLLNTLNIIYSFSITQNIEAVKDTLLSLIKYCRTILRDDMQFMRIEEEAAHLGNYLHILELRYDRHFSYYIEIEGGVEKAPILPLMLQLSLIHI